MQIKLDRFILDEKDFFIFFMGLFLLAAFILRVSIAPFRLESLVVVFLFLLVTRSLISSLKFTSYFYIAFLGFLFSLFLSPYGLALYFLIAMIIYRKTNLI
ncbi:hypothetical protein A3C28_02685 [Candidatus Roizmanbacteria bacterium RIFCSPHIGHO2_02_FULL_39_9]|uniref:Uncharacterized protein n=2 Tax=Candidatus Roizmaniibacteriota TaxID=1752723 RepID=A0A1F7I1Y3_9BACT|nr:MAG: hypothetical protein A3C28_02685 [Candidatus Roizmanbacteria bacterium RIFCSPHIGHO2_02_FULL_39_9]OGK37386.1 MAG: hypothetical protein A3F60_02175 [Candidatus Roizmanbacteria bacterium RIFCSPHIGHO2_12_FULL_39_8]